MKLIEIEMGTKLELEVFNNLGEKVRPSLISELEWVEDDLTAFIAAPILEGVIYPLHVDTEMNVCIYVKDDLFKFKAKVLSRKLKDNLALVKIEALSDIIKIQRRQFFRFDWSVPIRYRMIESLRTEYNEDTPFIKAITRDMSGGGLSIGIEEKIELGKLIECELTLNNDKKVRFYGKVVRSIKRSEEEIYKFEIGIIYRKIENKDREEIIKYIFQEQRKLRKKGLI